MKRYLFTALFVLLLVFTSCRKGYRVRVANYYLEKFDSVVIGSHNITFTDVEVGMTTDYTSVTSGNHSVRFVTEDGTAFYGLVPLRQGGGGDRTIQVDGLKTVNVFED